MATAGFAQQGWGDKYGFIASIIIGFSTSLVFALILYWLDRYEKEPILLLGGVFAWGAVVAAGAAFIINTILGVGVYIFTNDEAATSFTTASFIAPIVEESLKGLAVLLVFLFSIENSIRSWMGLSMPASQPWVLQLQKTATIFTLWGMLKMVGQVW